MGASYRVTVVSYIGYHFPFGYSMLWWTQLSSTGLGWWHRTRPALTYLGTWWLRRHTFLNADDGLIASANPLWLQSDFDVLIGLF